MKAMILAAGRGTRLRPFTDQLPKCLMPINGRPILEWWLSRLMDIGIEGVLINTHYRADQVNRYLSTSRFGSYVDVVFEPMLLGTAGTVVKNKDFFSGEDGMLLHADNFCLADLSEFIAAHKNREPNTLITMMTFLSNRPSESGIVEVDKRGVVIGFYEKVKKPPGSLANGAVYILTNELLSSLGCVEDFSTQVLPQYVGKIQSYFCSQTFIDIGTPESYFAASRLAMSDGSLMRRKN